MGFAGHRQSLGGGEAVGCWLLAAARDEGEGGKEGESYFPLVLEFLNLSGWKYLSKLRPELL